MSEKFESQSPQENPEDTAKKEIVEDKINHLRTTFDAAELALTEADRETAKAHLPDIYNTLMNLNKSLAQWNPEGDLTEAEFDELNRRRKILSNAVGIMTSSGQVRHNLNADAPESLE